MPSVGAMTCFRLKSKDYLPVFQFFLVDLPLRQQMRFFQTSSQVNRLQDSLLPFWIKVSCKAHSIPVAKFVSTCWLRLNSSHSIACRTWEVKKRRAIGIWHTSLISPKKVIKK